MPGIDFGLRLPPCVPIVELAEFAVAAEQQGFETVWIPDSQFLWRDVWTAATLIAARTERINIGVAVTNFETRHVAVTASAIASVDELSGGRVRVAFGTGDSSVKTLGLSPTRHQRLRDQFALLRRLLTGEEVVWTREGRYGGRPVRMRHAPTRRIPLYMAASGPRSLTLAGEIADGVIVATGVAPPLVQRALGYVARGAEWSGRTLADLDVCLGAHTVIADDEPTAVRFAKPLCLASAQLGMKAALAAVGISIDVPPVIEGVYPDITHAESWDLAVRVADRYIDGGDAQRYAEAFTLAGTVEQVRQRLAAVAELPVTSVYLLGVSSYELPRGQLTAFGASIIPDFAGRGAATAG